MHCETLGDVFVSVCRADPDILLNRCVGLGTSGAVNDARIDRLIRIYREHEVKRAFISVPDQAGAADIAERLTARKLHEARLDKIPARYEPGSGG